MEHVDDDFGDLYAEVEVQASSAINSVPGFSELQIENEENVRKEEEGKAEVLEKVSNQKEDSGCDSDDDDDLKIVLNSDDDEGLGFQISARDANPRSGLRLEDEYDDQDRDGVGGGKVVGLECQGENVEQSLNGGVGERGNGVKPGFHSQYSQYKYIRSQSTAYASNLKGNGCAAAASSFYSTGRGEREDNGFGKRMGLSSLFPKGGHNFSIPRSRTIFDVNIDIFEQKPWRNPGADITDYFNFGLNEDSWKVYCNQVDEYRHKAATPTKPLAPESFQLTEAYEGGGEDEMVTQEGTGERIHNRCIQPVPSMTSEMTKGRAIQVEDSIVERISSMDVMRPLVRDSDVIHITVQDSMEHSSGSVMEDLENSIQKASPNGGVGLDEDGGFLCFSSASEDELQSESLDGNHEAMELSVPKRSKRITTDDLVPFDCEGDESHQLSDVEHHHWREVTACGSDGNSEAIENLNNTKEKISEDTCTMDPSVLEAESSAGKRGYAGHCKAYKDGDYIDNGDSRSHTRRRSTKSATECRKSVKSDYTHQDLNLSYFKRDPNDSRYHTRHRSTAHHTNGSHSGSKLQAHFENECSSRLDTEEIYDAHLSPVGHGGRNDMPHAFDYYHGENRSYYNESELSSDYYGERFSDYEIGGDCTRGLHKKGYRSSCKMDRHIFRDSDEEEYCHEQRRFFMKEEVMVKDWCQYEHESPREKYAPYSEDKRVSGWKRKEGLHFRKRVKCGDFFLDYRHTDDIQQGKYRRSLTYAEREKDYEELQYGGHEAYAGREVKSPGRNRRRFGSPSDNYWSAGDGDDYLRYRDVKALTSHSFQEPCPTDNSWRRGNTMSVNHVYEKRGKCMRQWSKRTRNTVSFGSHSDVFDTEEDALSADMKFRRKHHWQDELQWNEDKIISRRRDGETHTEGTIYSLDNTPRHKSRHGFNHMVEPIDDHHVDGYRYRQIRKGNSDNKFDRTSNGIHRGSHEQPFLMYGDTVDSQLVVGEQKSPHRYYDRHEKIGWRDEEERTWKDFDASQPEKITQAEPDFEAHEKDEEWLDKFPVPKTNEALDIEEGQIMTEELPSGPTENIYNSDTVAQSRNVKALPNGNGKTGGTVEEYEDSRILQVMAKMERRRERFKEPITLSKEKEQDNAAKLKVDLENRTPVSNHQRPVRKRRWRDS